MIGVAVVLLAGAATALAGPIAFVGLIVPHGVRAVVGPDYRRVLPLSCGYGAVLVVAADVVGRVVLPPAEVQVGIMTAVVGVPVFLLLIRRGRIGAPVTTVLNRPAAATGPVRGSDAPAAADVVRRAAGVPVRRTRIVVAALAVLLVLVFAARMLLGDFTITLPDFFRILCGTEIPGASYILMESKLPRAVLGVLVGLAFGVGGAIFQTTLRNPLASPDIIGVSIGASAAAVFAIVTLGRARLPGLGRSRARRRAGLARWSAQQAGPVAGNRLVLVGVGAQRRAVLGDPVPLHPRRRVGRPAGAALAHRQPQPGRLADDPDPGRAAARAGCRSSFWLARSQPGRRARRGRRRRARRHRRGASDAAAAARRAAGRPRGRRRRPIAFVAFLAGPIARALNGGRTTLARRRPGRRRDRGGRRLRRGVPVPDVNFPVGVVTGALGAPFLLWLLATGPHLEEVLMEPPSDTDDADRADGGSRLVADARSRLGYGDRAGRRTS